MSDLLFQLEVEEVPALAVKGIAKQLEILFKQNLDEQFLEFGTIEVAATHRRFMVFISNLKETAEIRETTILGPAKAIALDERGLPQVPLQKFIEQNKFRLADVVEMETPKGTYMGVIRVVGGENAEDLLKTIIPGILAEITFTKGMIWNESRVPFIRPIRNILALYKNQLIDMEFAGVKSSNRVNGHSLLSFEYFTVGSFVDYIQGLMKNFVILKEEERRQKIRSEIQDIEEDLDVTVELSPEMLDYYVYSNEYPVVFSGTFQSKYLTLPPEVISAFMETEKKLVPARDKKGSLKNIFVGVTNIPDENKNVARGFEKVIHATFEDAQFFWDMDLREDFYGLRQSLKNFTFQKELGNYYDKSERLLEIVEFLTAETGHSELRDSLVKAAPHCKNDLVTRMVREFPVMQGIIGGLYLMEKGENVDVWKAIYGQYQPKGFTNENLEHLGAGILSIADRIDSIAGLYSRGVKISGSKDPYGIRRDANAIVKIIIHFNLDIDMAKLIRKAVASFITNAGEGEGVIGELQELFHARVENCFKEFLGIRYDLVNAVLQRDTWNINDIYQRLRAVSQVSTDVSIAQLISLNKRLKNIIRNFDVLPFSEELLQQQEEKVLFDIFKEAKVGIEEAILNKDYLKASAAILEMKPVVDMFFDKVLIMAKDPAKKNNRISLLQRIDELMSKIADFSLIMENPTPNEEKQDERDRK